MSKKQEINDARKVEVALIELTTNAKTDRVLRYLAREAGRSIDQVLEHFHIRRGPKGRPFGFMTDLVAKEVIAALGRIVVVKDRRRENDRPDAFARLGAR